MSIYQKENPNFLKEALVSVFDQTLKPSEVVLVEDGKLTNELNQVVEDFQKKYPTLKVVKFEKNRGLGYALNDGLKECTNEYVFRMDTDDICRRERFEIQLKYMLEHPEIDVLGGNICEFKNSLNEEMRIKKMPNGLEIDSYMRKRNPLNHVTVCFKKTSVLKCGGYKPLLYLEDYFLWVRMYNNGSKLENLDEQLVFVRIGNGFEARRGNKKQIEGWKQLQKYMLDENLIDFKRYKKNILNMYLMVYCPTFIRKLAYKFLLRNN